MANYGKKGWIKLWRSEMDNPLYWSVSFDKWHAWMDLCMMADDKGTVKTSLEALKNRWNWTSIKKVRAFLGTVQGTGLGTVTAIPRKGTLIRINTDKTAKTDRGHNSKKGTVKGTQSEIEEVTSKEVGRASFEVSPPNNIERIIALQDELGDEYE